MKKKNLLTQNLLAAALIFFSSALEIEASGVVQMQRAQQQRQQQAYQQAVQQQAAQAQQQLQQQYQQQVQQQQRRLAAQQQQFQQQMRQLPKYSSQVLPSLPTNASQHSRNMNTNEGQDDYSSGVLTSGLGTNSTTDVMDIRQVWDTLDQSSELWLKMVDQEPKEITIAEYIDLFRTQGAVIRKSPPQYVALIDQMLIDSPEMAQRPFSDLLRLAAILEYDYDIGVDRDALARQFLGDQLYQQNKERLGIQ